MQQAFLHPLSPERTRNSHGRNGFAGIGNFTRAFAHDPQFWDTLTFSAQWAVVEAGLQLLLGPAPVLVVNRRSPGGRRAGRWSSRPGPSPAR